MLRSKNELAVQLRIASPAQTKLRHGSPGLPSSLSLAPTPVCATATAWATAAAARQVPHSSRGRPPRRGNGGGRGQKAPAIGAFSIPGPWAPPLLIMYKWSGHVAAAEDLPLPAPAIEGGGAGAGFITVILLWVCAGGEEWKVSAFAGLLPYPFPDSLSPCLFTDGFGAGAGHGGQVPDARQGW